MKTDPKNLALVSKLLNDMSNEILLLMRTQGLNNVLDWNTDHTYRKITHRVSVHKELLQPWRTKAKEVGLDVDTMAVEMITHYYGDHPEPHIHKGAYAVITLLGEWEGVPEPKGAFYWLGSKEAIFPAVCSKVTLQVTPNTIHGFLCVDPKNTAFSILSIQSRIIDKDFFLV